MTYSDADTCIGFQMLNRYTQTKLKYKRQHVSNWIKMFNLYLHMRTDRVKFMEFLMENS